MKRKIGITISAIVLLTVCSSRHSFSESEFSTRTVTVGNTVYGYRVYLPMDRQPSQKLPVMLYLHGSNRRGDNNQDQLLDIGDQIKANPQNFSFIIVFPQCRPDKFWAGEMNEQASEHKAIGGGSGYIVSAIA